MLSSDKSKKFLLIDQCRKKLISYTIQAFNKIPRIDQPVILDIGCGTGVPSLALLEEIDDALVVAVDRDEESLNWFRQKLDKSGFTERIKLIQASFFQTEKYRQKFDLILAEGILHIVGFKPGFLVLKEMLKDNGYMIIHDENKDVQEKKNFFKLQGFEIISSFELDRNIWWNHYLKLLKQEIERSVLDELFQQEIKYIQEFKLKPEEFESVYYILKNKSYSVGE